MQYYDSWPFQNDSRVPNGSKSRRRTDTFRTLGPVKQRLARANGQARYQRRNGGDWSGFVAVAEQLTDDGWLRLSQERLRLAGEAAAGETAEAEQVPALPAIAQVTARQQDAGGMAAEADGGDDDEDAECDAAFPGEESTGPADGDDFYADAWETR